MKRYWMSFNTEPETGDFDKTKHSYRMKAPYPWKCYGWIPTITGKHGAAIVYALIDAKNSEQAYDLVIDYFGDVHFNFCSPKPLDWKPDASADFYGANGALIKEHQTT